MTINKLTALNRGNPLNSNGSQVADTVNSLIDRSENDIPASIQAVSDRTTVLEGEVSNIESEIADLDNKFINLDQEINLEAQSKSSFLANAEQRKREYAGSGFAEWGRQFNGKLSVDWENINEGLFTLNTLASTLFMGRGASDKIGSSRTDNALVIVDGTQHNIYGTAYLGNNEPTSIKFPPAPDGTKTYDSATGVVTEHASAAEAFEGVLSNGDFRLGDVDLASTSGTYSVSNGKLQVGNGSGVSGVRAINNDATNTNNVRIEVFVESGGESGARVSWSNADGSQFINKDLINGSNTIITDDFFSASSVQVLLVSSAGTPLIVNSWSIMPVTESVITSRKDLVFLETWHEAISDKNVVFPLGNVQYGAGSFDGVDLDSYSQMGSIPIGYAAFGEWHTPTSSAIYGHLWDNLTDAEKRVFINNPDNNIYYDSDADKLIQVRYRIRVVEGLGDDWLNVIPATASIMRYGANPATFVRFRGSSVVSADYYIVGDRFLYGNNRPVGDISGEPSLWAEGTDDITYEGKAISIALVQR